MRIPRSCQGHLRISKPTRPTQKPGIFALRISLEIRSPSAFLKVFLRSPGLTPNISPSQRSPKEAWEMCGHHFSPQQNPLSPSARYQDIRKVPPISPVTCENILPQWHSEGLLNHNLNPSLSRTSLSGELRGHWVPGLRGVGTRTPAIPMER